MKDKLYDDVMAEVFRDDPALAVESLNTLLEEGCTQGELLVILRQLAQAQGGISQISARAGLNEKSLYRRATRASAASMPFCTRWACVWRSFRWHAPRTPKTPPKPAQPMLQRWRPDIPIKPMKQPWQPGNMSALQCRS